MKKALHCATCGAALSVPIEILSGKDPAVTEPEPEDGKPLTASGVAFKSYEAIVTVVPDDPPPLAFVPQYWINPADLTKAVRTTGKCERLSGCCGPAGIDGPNQICRCGAEVGTLQADCWTSHVFIPEPHMTRWDEVPEQD